MFKGESMIHIIGLGLFAINACTFIYICSLVWPRIYNDLLLNLFGCKFFLLNLITFYLFAKV